MNLKNLLKFCCEDEKLDFVQCYENKRTLTVGTKIFYEGNILCVDAYPTRFNVLLLIVAILIFIFKLL